jgi:hypothetical protein
MAHIHKAITVILFSKLLVLPMITKLNIVKNAQPYAVLVTDQQPINAHNVTPMHSLLVLLVFKK